MKCSKPSFAVVSLLLVLLSLKIGTLNAREVGMTEVP